MLTPRTITATRGFAWIAWCSFPLIDAPALRREWDECFLCWLELDVACARIAYVRHAEKHEPHVDALHESIAQLGTLLGLHVECQLELVTASLCCALHLLSETEIDATHFRQVGDLIFYLTHQTTPDQLVPIGRVAVDIWVDESRHLKDCVPGHYVLL